MIFGIDIGTTSVAGVAVDERGSVVASLTLTHNADLPSRETGVFEQDPLKLLETVDCVIGRLERIAGKADAIGWTGQMHGIVGVDRALKPVTPFVTWRDARRYGGRVMQGWRDSESPVFKCLPVCGLMIAARTGHCEIDGTFLHSWHMEEVGGIRAFSDWIPEEIEGSMLGDNQAGVYAAQSIVPGCAVVNLGTSGQLSVVGEGSGGERRPYPGGVLRCRASFAGGRAFSDLRKELELSWEEMNDRADTDERIRECVEAIAEDLIGDIDLTGIDGLVGIGNGIRLNPALRRAVERKFGCACVIPDVDEMAAYGAALYKMHAFD